MAGLVGLDDAKAHLDLKSTTEDAELLEFIEAATSVVEDHVGAVLARTVVERCPEGYQLMLATLPVLSVTSVDPFYLYGNSYPLSDIIIDNEAGILYRKTGFPFFNGPFRVTYTAGRVAVPPNVRLATLIIIAHLWETQRPRPTRFPTLHNADEIPAPGMSYAVPRRALELLGPRRVAVL